MSNASSIADILEKILNFTASVAPELRQSLREGLTSEQINEMTQNFAFHLPKEVQDLYKWHDGMQSDSEKKHKLLYYHYFLPLDEALDLHHSLTGENYIEEKGLLPLFEFEGEYYASCCGNEEQDTAPVLFLYHDESIAYDSLTTMLSSILECYEQKAYIPGETDVDEELVAQIKLKWNPMRELSGLGLYDHP